MNRDTTTIGFLLAALAASAISGFAAAGVHDNSWTNTGTGDWFDVSNWSMEAIPAFDHRTDISNGGSAILASLSAQCHALTLGDNFGGSGTLSIETGGLLATNTFSTIAEQGESSGTVNVTGIGSEWTIGEQLHVGLTGTGILNIQDGGTVSSDDHANIGAGNGGTGTVTVSGADSQWTVGIDLRVGRSDNATGWLEISNGGTVNCNIGAIGDLEGAAGTATVTGDGSTWTCADDLYVGQAGDGTLNIENGGAVENVDAFVGNTASSDGMATVTGAGSTWNCTELLIVGELGDGTLIIENGGAVITDVESSVGGDNGGVGMVTVSGAGSTWTTGEGFRLGGAGNGTLTISDGGVVNSEFTSMGLVTHSLFTGVGTAIVTGAGSTWNHEFDLRVGRRATGDLTIEDGGVVNTRIGVIGDRDDGNGTALITGPGSIWTSSEQFFIGVAGNGELTVADQGEVESAGAFTIARDPGTTGTLNIGDGGAAGIVDAASVTGGDGNATLNFNHNQSDYSFTTDGTSAGDIVSIEGNINVNHVGLGTTTLEGGFHVYPYVGTTTIDSGTLNMAGVSILDSTVTVNAGGTFKGVGFTGPVTVNGGTISPGFGIGTTITIIGGLTLDSNAELAYDLDGLLDFNDTISVNGDLVLDGTINITNLGGMEEGTYTLIDYSGAITDNGLQIGNAPAGFAFAIDTSEPGAVTLDVAVDSDCPADISDPTDGQVNVSDLFVLLANWGSDGPGADLAVPNDVVNISDLLVLLAGWGSCSG